jgi:hypothetical protein
VAIDGGPHGDQAALAARLYAIPRVLAAGPGLAIVLTLLPIHGQPASNQTPCFVARADTTLAIGSAVTGRATGRRSL